MNSVLLPGGRRTTQLGFGCAYLTPQNARALDAAYDAGIRHFDVARSYGAGLTERILGRFLKRRRAEVTLTSKYGIRPPFSHPLHAAARAVFKPLLRTVRRKPIVESRLGSLAFANRKASFNGIEAVKSLDISLRNLGVERLDLFLMHEAEPADLADPSLLEAMQKETRAGRIGAFGVGGKSQFMQQVLSQHPGFGSVLQYDWSVAQTVAPFPVQLNILYRVYGDPARRLREVFREQPGALRRWSDAIGHDLAVPSVLEQLLLRAALELQPDSLVLFSSTEPAHIGANVRAASDAQLGRAARKLAELMHPAVLPGTGFRP